MGLPYKETNALIAVLKWNCRVVITSSCKTTDVSNVLTRVNSSHITRVQQLGGDKQSTRVVKKHV